MKIKKLVHFQSVFEERAIPSDIPKLLNLMYYSKSKQELLNIGEMDLTHFIRVFCQMLQNNNSPLKEQIDKMKQALDQLVEEKNDNLN